MRRSAVVWWACVDWVYAARWQLRSLRRGAPPEEYRTAPGGALPVVLVPGVYESWRFVQPLTEVLHRAGHPVHVITGLGSNSGEVPAMARAVRAYVDEQDLRTAALVGHSKGGLIGKQLLVHCNGDGRFDRLVTVNTPFSGSSLARFLPLPAVRVFTPGDPLLRELAAATHVDRLITSVYSAVDPNIPGSSHLDGARNVRVDTVGHFRVLSDPRVQAAVLDALAAPAPVPPPPRSRPRARARARIASLRAMRLGVLDVGSNTVHLLVVDAHPGARPAPATSHRTELRLAEHLTDSGDVSEAGAVGLVGSVRDALAAAADAGCEEVLGFATSALREAGNGQAVLDRVLASTGMDLQVLTGQEEARLTFLAVRRWFGWSAGRLLLLDIGGGSLEAAIGPDEEPDVAVSLPLGAGRLTRDHLPGDPPSAGDVTALRTLVRRRVATVVRDLTRGGPPDLAVGSSKTFASLARTCGAAPREQGPLVPRVLRLDDLAAQVPRLARMTTAQRAALPGVSAGRARQLLAGALVAEAAMELLGVPELRISPWALREGLLLRHQDQMEVDDPAQDPLAQGA